MSFETNVDERQASRRESVVDAFRKRRQQLTRTLPELPGVPYFFLLPFFVLFGVFLAFPIVYTLYLSFFEFQSVGGDALLTFDFGFYQFTLTAIADLKFVGLSNYERLLSDGQFHQAMYNTVFILVVQVPLMIVIALALAVALDAAFVRARGLFRTLLALPVSANLVAYATVFVLLMQETGLVNFMLGTVGIDPIPWFQNDFWSRMTIVGAVTWRWTGYNMIILLAGLQNVPRQLYEAAEIDGANRIEKFRYVTLPQLKPVLLFVVVTSTIGTFKLFSEPLIVSQAGASAEATRTIVQYIYQMAFKQFQLGYASALTWVLIAVVSILSVVQIKAGGDGDE
ncbi:carbohydrate ABC transporter permease [Haloarchaeobius sp. HME9146]|uniref:carbohydrate ABC transporter permease n=1 Tax=unclassified Haloarchaeobius TaxID=2614452 RepID=UPI0021C0A90A|nr:sugar ABC transporter permease [Haloarchaeobius sp. HME9146]MCT9095603.1 sugar ABC transporter permease [Haloarchaeobius sp. HME9146]